LAQSARNYADYINCSGGSGWCGGGSCPALVPLTYTDSCNSAQGTKSFNFSSPNGNTVMWRVDNGSISSSLNYIIDYNKACIYKVKCLYSGCLLGSEEIIVPVVVDTDYSVICDPLNGNQTTYFFQDSSSYLLGYGTATYTWDFGDGNSSILQNPNHVYASNGTYNVNLTVNYGTYSCNKITTISVTDFNVSYSYSGLECENTPTMIFTSVSSTNINSWNWDFGDGASSGREIPRRTYTQSGIFTTSLQITDINGCIATPTNPLTIEQNPIIDSINNLGPFCSNDSPIDLSSEVSFNITNGEIASWSGIGIDYDPITQIYSFNPVLAGGGSHEIYVTITDNNGCYDKKSIIIDVLCIEKPRIFGESEYCYNSNFWFPGNNISLYTESFYNTYQWYKNGVVMWGAYSMWDYQVGVGIYDYMVEVLDDNGCTVFSEPFTLNIHDVPNIFSVSTNINPCPNEEIILSHNGNQNDVDYYWNTLPQQTASTVTVTSIPDYEYTVTAINEFGCKSTSNSIIIPSEIPLCGVLSGCLCDDEIMNSSGLINITGLNNSWQYSNYEWLFNGNSFSPSQNASSLIIDPLDANFLTICSGSITLEVTDNNGCLSVSNPLYIEPNCNSCFSTNTDYNISQTICASESFVFGANTYSAPGVFSSNFQSINGCDSNVVLDLTVLPLQTSFQNIIICEGDSVVIGTSIYYQNGIYTDTFNVDAGCDSIQITEIIISDPIANLSFSGSLLNAFVIGGTPPYYFESGNQNGIIFTSTNNFGTPVSINPINNGMYYFFIIDANNCISDTVFYQVDIAPSSFSDFQINNLFIYPNPSSDIFNITFNSETIQDLSIRILNVVGAEIYLENKEEFIGEYTKQISLDDYGKGIYFLEIETNDGVINKKLILQ
jgi:PKD repeat protein